MNLKSKILLWSVLVQCMCISTYAQWSRYLVWQSLKGVHSTWHGLSLNAEVWKHAQADMRDIRIIGVKGADTLEVPYIWNNQLATSQGELPIYNKTQQGNIYYYSISSPDKLFLNGLKLFTSRQNFEWSVNLEGSNDQHNWFQILKNYRLIGIENTYTAYQYTLLPFDRIQYDYYRIGIQAADDPQVTKVQYSYIDSTAAPLEVLKPIHVRSVEISHTQQQDIIIQLDGSRRIHKIALSILDTIDYYRPVTLAYLYDSVVVNDTVQYLYRKYSNSMLSSMADPELLLNDIKTVSVKISIHNGSNMPLNINDVQAYGAISSMSLRIPDTSYKYFLLYGNADVQAPRYDLVQFKQNIPNDITYLRLGNPMVQEHAVSAPKPLFQNSIWLWIIIGVILIVLALFTFKMLQQRDNPSD